MSQNCALQALQEGNQVGGDKDAGDGFLLQQFAVFCEARQLQHLAHGPVVRALQQVGRQDDEHLRDDVRAIDVGLSALDSEVDDCRIACSLNETSNTASKQKLDQNSR